MTLTISLTSNEEARLAAVARQEGLDPVEAARRVLNAYLPPLPSHRREALVEEYHALLDQEDARPLSDAQATRRREVEAELDRLEDQDPVEQEADRRLKKTGDKLDEILALLRALPRKDTAR